MKTKTRRKVGPSPLREWERDLYYRPPPEPIDEWAERVIVLPRGVSSVPGRLSLDWTPYLREPLRRSADERVESVGLCWSTQVAKTLGGIIVNLFQVAVKKKPAIQVMPTDPAAHGICVERYQEIIRASPELAALLDDRRVKEMKRDAIRLDGIWINFGGARSPTFLSSRAKGCIGLDETDKYEDWAGREADPIELATERARTYVDSIIFQTSTPTTEQKYIWQMLQSSTNERYNVPCPHCGRFQVFEMGTPEKGTFGIKWPDGVRDPDKITDERLAWYECRHCHKPIEDASKHGMLLRGVWAPKGVDVRKNGNPAKKTASIRRSGFHLWAAYSPWLTFSDIAAKFLKCFKGGRTIPRLLMNFRNSWQAEPWYETAQELKPNTIRACHAGYRQGDVPEGVRILTAALDVQESAGSVYLFYTIRGWGDLGESWLIKCGRLGSWEAVAELFRGQYRMASGKFLKPAFALIDSGFKTKEVYQFCLKTGAWAIKGSGRALFQQKETLINVGGEEVRLLSVNSDYYKDALHRAIVDRSPVKGKDGKIVRTGRWHLPGDLPDEYYDHMTAEQKVQEIEKRSGQVRFVWRCVPDGAPNHYFDCECYQLAGCELLQLETKRQPPSSPRDGDDELKGKRNDIF